MLPAAPGGGTASVVFLCLLLLFFGQLAFGARHLSLTADEPAHITRGYVYLTSDDFWMVPVLGHPPLIEAWAASPLLLNADRPRPTEVPHWRESTALYIQSLLPRLGTVDQIEVLTRVPVMLLATVLMALVFRWTSEMAGGWAGVCAAALMTWDPTMIAHAQLDTTDLGVTLFIFASAYMFWRLVREPSLTRLLATGLLTGLAMAAKHSGLAALLLMGQLVVWGWIRGAMVGHGKNGVRHRLLSGVWRWSVRGMVIFLVSWLVLWAVYRFETERLATFPWFLPFPSHVESLRTLFASHERFSFLRGRLREGGWWWYSPYVFLIKTPLPFMAAISFTIYDEVRRGARAWLRDAPWTLPTACGRGQYPLWLFPVLYCVITMAGGMHLGYRHLLPILPFIYVGVGRAIGRASFTRSTDAAPARVAFLRSRRRPWRWVAMALAAWYILGTWCVYPYTLAYFNELVGGSDNGYRHVVDSNVDWGHGYKALARTMREKEIPEVRLSYWTWVDPASYGVEYTPLPPTPGTEEEQFPAFAPPAGTYAISATPLQGILLRDPDLYEWFRHREPIAQPGYGLLVYQVESAEPSPSWVGLCATPAPPLSLSEIDRGFGGQVQRVAYFDCAQSWIYPDGGGTAGWYVLHQDALSEASAWIGPHVSDARLSYAHRRPGRLPPFRIYEWTPHGARGGPTYQPAKGCCVSVLSGAGGPEVSAVYPLSTPVSFDGPFILRGYRVSRVEERTLELQTWWEVRASGLAGSTTAASARAAARPFSLMGHALDAEGNAVGVADGLGVPLSEMRPGDWLVQRHRFLLSEEDIAGVDEVWFQTGGYWLDTMERWPVLEDGEAIGDRVILTSVKLAGR